MQSNDKPLNGQADTPELPPATEPRFEALREWWNNAWDEGGALHARWEDIRRARHAGWHGMAHWIKAALGLAGICAVIILLDGATDALADRMHRLLTAVPRVQVGADTSTGVSAVVDQPIRSYIAAHSAGLPISASTVYTLWQVTGLFSLIGGFITRSNGIRLTWSCWGFAGIAMVWTTTPDTSRTVATAIAVLAWTIASAFALRGLNLRPRVFSTVHTGAPQITVQPQIHIPAQPDGPAPDSVRQLGR
ncbi:hypothetical protein OG195_44800 (plasmid) [Streptomyces sp. NBC_01362]|uniref:hypothetical protein n=1 Tax=Streptomyces sp. NBC_01362 TaxID=2903839 RepID=UPI002E31C936|nr:hypothetical protein [Streptomyces sp. NBC_01362]